MQLRISEQLSQIIGFLRNCLHKHQYYSSLLLDVEKKQLDLLHYLELDSSGYRERCKISTQLRQCLLERRTLKDKLEELAPIVDFLSQPQNKGIPDKLAQTLGAVRRVERYHADRKYKPRVLPSPTANSTNDNAGAKKE